MDHSAMVLSRFAGEGVQGVACTPHLLASDSETAPIEEFGAIRQQLQTRCPEGLTLYGGWEIMLDRPGLLRAAPGLTLGSSHTVLVEWPHGEVPAWATNELARLRGNGLVPLVAHAERYRGVTLELIREWRALGAAIQTDATILVSGGDKGEFAKAMLRDGLVDLLASDNHGDRRSLGMTRWWLEEIGAGHQGERLTAENPRRLLGDQALLPVDGIEFEQGMFERLRAWWRKRKREPTTDSEGS
ncbi:MAG: hypothetical protein MNPFHGCM_02856 [Gemmatimonadaceae bacterium]|nr:hypothetical protein [Gemmatimonadaceae bacterium]